MIVIADSGSTKTQWCFLQPDGTVQTTYTLGINPYYQTTDQIAEALTTEFKAVTPVDALFFYGAGCANDDKKSVVAKAIEQLFDAKNIVVKSDLEAAAFSLCQNQPGIACILGTGSNSCYFDGQSIVDNVSPLGFILGDEGSGAVIGKKLVGDILKKQLPKPIIELFFDNYQTSASDIIEHVYRKPFPNRYLAQYSKFVSTHIHFPEMQALVMQCFDEFVVRNVLQYPQATHLKVHFTGSIAHHFRPQLETVLSNHQLQLGTVCLSPMEGLIRYHQQTPN